LEEGGCVTMNLRNLLRMMLRMLGALPQEIVAALWRLLIILLLLLLLLLRGLWELLLRLFGKRREKPSEKEKCGEIPPNVKRKPDPCLYDQFYLQAQGYAVTWNNPDIWITLPDGTPANSYQLVPDTDYVVHAQIHDASFDPALATQVRCAYRPWSFNSPDRTPIELNPDGTEKVVILHIPPWSQQVAQFHWHTPASPGHYCLQVECFHPDDKNPNNNLGQENTQIVGAHAGQVVTTEALLFNRLETGRRVRITADQYRIPKGEIRLKLATRTLPLRKRSAFDAVYNLMLTHDPARGGLKTQSRYVPSWIAYAYRGFEQLQEGNARGTSPIAPPWRVEANGTDVGGNAPVELRLEAKQRAAIPIVAHIPADATAGTSQHLNFTAYGDDGKVLGGVTLLVVVEA
jgi:hypothetical protein